MKPKREPGNDSIDSLDFVYEIACLAWKEGLSANFIAKKLGYAGDAKAIMKVKRALLKAQKSGILVLNPPKKMDYHTQLKKKWPLVDFTIVEGNKLLGKGDAVHIAASDVLATKIEELWNTAKADVVIANAGGHAVSETVKYLHQRIGPILEPHADRRLVFISLNSAGRARTFQQSSNFLAVRMSEMYDGHHIAVLGPADTSTEKEFKHLTENISLLVCGAGGPTSLLVERAKEERIRIPPEMVGDIAFTPLDEQGRRVQDSHLQGVIENYLHAAPLYDEIKRIVQHPPRAVLVVLSGESKLPTALALLRGGLVSQIVMDIALAKSLSALATP
jgi:DNA-binding transcriptional regulator LsrR (DeoR family)